MEEKNKNKTKTMYPNQGIKKQTANKNPNTVGTDDMHNSTPKYYVNQRKNWGLIFVIRVAR